MVVFIHHVEKIGSDGTANDGEYYGENVPFESDDNT